MYKEDYKASRQTYTDYRLIQTYTDYLVLLEH